MTTLFKFLSIWPLWLAQSAGAVMGWLVFLGSGVYRQRFLANAQQAGLTWRQWVPAVAAAGKLVAELPRLWLGSPVRVRWQGAQHVDAALLRGKGVVMLTPHLGCFEVTAQAYARRYGRTHQPITVLFRPPRKAWLREVVGQARNRPGLDTAPTTMAGVKQMVKALKLGQSLGLLPDQVPPAGMGVWAPFFGRDAYTMTLSARLARQTDATVLLVWGERLSWGRGFTVHVQTMDQPLVSDTTVAATQINAAMEQLVLACPQQYLWAYARYKQPRQDA